MRSRGDAARVLSIPPSRPCSITSRSSRLIWTSASITSAPRSIARANDSSVFAGTSADWPRWAMTRGRELRRHGLVSGASTATPSFGEQRTDVGRARLDWHYHLCQSMESTEKPEEEDRRWTLPAESTRHRQTARRSPLPRLASGLDQVSGSIRSERAGLHAIEMNKPAPDFFEGGILGNGGLGVIVCTRPDAVVLYFGHNNVWDIRARREQPGHAPDVRRGLGTTSRLVVGADGSGVRLRRASPPTAPPRSRSTSPSTRTPGSGTTARWPARTTTRNSRARGHADRCVLGFDRRGRPSCSGIAYASTPGYARSRSSSTARSRPSRSSSR